MNGPRGTGRTRLDQVSRRRGLTLSALTAASALFAVTDYTPLKLVPVDAAQAVILVALALAGVAGAMLGSRAVLFGVGAAMMVLGLLRLVTYGLAFAQIAGNAAGTAALLTGLGMAFIGIMLVAEQPTSGQRATPIGPD